MSTGGGVDERIRAVLDLGDSSGVVKALDREVNQLLDDFKRQSDLFDKGQMSSKDYTSALNKMKSEVSGLAGAMKDLGGGGGGSGLDGITSKIFALERGISSLASGTGLGRAGGLLESGLSLLGGPAGIGALMASIAYTIDNVAPKIKASWEGMWKQFSEEQVQAKIAELKAAGTAMKGEVDSFFARPVPGTEGMEAERQKKLATMFNVGTGTGDKNLRVGLLRALKESQGASPTNLSGEEKQEIKGIWEKLFPVEAAQAVVAEQGEMGGLIHQISTIAAWPAEMWKGNERNAAELKLRMAKILEDAAARSVSDLLIKLQQGGQPGVRAAEQLKDLISRFPQLFDAGMKTQIDDVLKMGKQIQTEAGGGPGIGRSQAVYRVPTETDLQREQEIEGLEGGRRGGRRHLEQQDRRMFERDAMQRLMEANPQLKMSDPQQRALMEHEAQAQWQMMMGGPHGRREQEQFERDAARRGRTAELIGEHPELTFDEAEKQARQETQRRERALYPERSRRVRRPATPAMGGEPRRRFLQGSIDRMNQEQAQQEARGPALNARQKEMLRKFGRQARVPLPVDEFAPPWPPEPPPPEPVSPPPAPHPPPAPAPVRAPAVALPQRETEAAYNIRMYDHNAKEIMALGQRQSEALRLEQQGLVNHAKTQEVVDSLQGQIKDLQMYMQLVGKNADNLLRTQQRTQQNTTGNP